MLEEYEGMRIRIRIRGREEEVIKEEDLISDEDGTLKVWWTRS